MTLSALRRPTPAGPGPIANRARSFSGARAASALLPCLLCALGALGCGSAESTDFDPRELARLPSIEPQLADASSETAVVLLDPAEAFSCRTSLPEWLEWGSASDRQLLVVLTRAPDRVEDRQLTLLRLPIQARLDALEALPETPRAYIFNGSTLMDQMDFSKGPRHRP